MSKRRAFSLVEMLVAVILISLLIGVAIFALKYQLIAISKTQKIGITKVIKYNQIRTSLQSIKYYIVDDYDTFGYTMQKLHPFFRGSQTELTYITESPIFSSNVALAQMKCEGKKLIYKEEKLYANIDFLRPGFSNINQKKFFYAKLNTCSFSYIFDKTIHETLVDKIPSSIVVNLVKDDKEMQIYVNIKSDYNKSIGIVRDAMYPVK